VSSQFISGLLFALVYLGEPSSIEIIPPFESRSYVELTVSALSSFGADVKFADEYRLEVNPTGLHAFSGKIEGDYSNAAFLDAFNYIGGDVEIENLKPDSLQGDRVYGEYFEKISKGTPTLDISDCPDLGPVLMAAAAALHGGRFTGTKRLKYKESDRGAVMKKELGRMKVRVDVSENEIVVYPGLSRPQEILDGHHDHRIVMALAVLLSLTGGSLRGTEAAAKSFPDFFDRLKRLGIKMRLE
jgi:3-phosphoshikimate 1-carboxyvinyltransferase